MSDLRARSELGTNAFWAQPAEVRDETFAQLRRDAPLTLHDPPEDPLGLPDQDRKPY